MPDNDPQSPAGITAEQLATLAAKLQDGDSAMETRVSGVADSVTAVASDVAEIRTGMAGIIAAMAALTTKIEDGPAVRSTQQSTAGGAPDVGGDTSTDTDTGPNEDHPVVIALRSSWKTYDKGAAKVSTDELSGALRSLVVAGHSTGHFVEPTKR